MKLTQKNVPRLGAFIESLYTALPALTGLNFMMIVIAVYEPVKAFILPYIPWFNFFWFVLGLSAVILAVTLVAYLYVVPSLWTFRNAQMHEFQSTVLDEIKELRKAMAAAGIQVKKEHPGEEPRPPNCVMCEFSEVCDGDRINGQKVDYCPDPAFRLWAEST